MTATRRAVLDMADDRHVLAMPDSLPDRIGAALPEEWELVVVEEGTDGSGDGARRASAGALAAVREAELYFGFGMPPELFDAATELVWAHSGAAGVSGSLHDAMLRSPVVFTNSAGVHAEPMAETVLGMILHFGRGLDFAVTAQREGRWWTEPFYAADSPLFELPDVTVGIVGFGGVGRAVARRCAALGAEVIAVRRGAPQAHTPRVVHGADGLTHVLDRADVLVVAAPETDETRGMLDAEAFSRMKPDAVLINVARGSLVDEAALLAALRAGRLRGAALDVFAAEPLADDHPLWSMPNVLITPHVSSVTRGFWERETGLILRNLERYLRGVPVDEWENVVDKEAGY